MAKTFRASYPGECADCGSGFEEGDDVRYNRDDELIGWDCCGEEQAAQAKNWAPMRAGDDG